MSTLRHRRNTLLIDTASRPAWGVSYTVTAFQPGGIVASASSGTTITLRAGHGFTVGDKFVINAGSDDTFSGTDTVQSTTATTIVMNNNTTVVVGDVLLNVGVDTGTTSPNFDASTITVYTTPDASGPTDADETITADAQGGYEYWHNGTRGVWELVRNSDGDMVEVLTDTAQEKTKYGVRYANQYATSGAGTTGSPWIGWTAAVASGVKTIFTKGYYDLDDELALPANCELVGEGPDSIIRAVDDITGGAGTWDNGDNVMEASSVSNVQVRNLMIDANKANIDAASGNNGLKFTTVTGGLIENVKVSNTSRVGSANGIGIWLTGSTDVVITNCVVDTVDYHGIAMSTGCSNIRVISNLCKDGSVANQSMGIQEGDTTASSMISIIGNTVDNFENGIRIQGGEGATTEATVYSSGVLIAGNTIKNVDASGIRINAKKFAVIGNVIEGDDTTNDGISITSNGTLVDGIISGNQISECDNNGINVDGASTGFEPRDVVISGNLIRLTAASSDHGIDLVDCHRFAVVNNVIRDVGRSGISAIDCEYLTVDGNIVTNPGQNSGAGVPKDGVYISSNAADTTQEVVITDNVLVGTGAGTEYGIRVAESGTTQNVTISGNQLSSWNTQDIINAAGAVAGVTNTLFGTAVTIGQNRDENLEIVFDRSANNPKIITGTGDPLNNVTADVGSIFLRVDGGTNTTLYVKESGTDATGWVQAVNN